MISVAAIPRAPSVNVSDLLREPYAFLRWSRVGWLSLRHALQIGALAMLAIFSAPGVHATPLRVYLAAGAETFNLVEWEARHLTAHAGTIAAALWQPAASVADDLETLHTYFLTPGNARSESRWEAERAIERELTALIDDVGIARLTEFPAPGVFPPVTFRFTSPPSVLVVAPRDRLVVQQSVFLEPGVSEAERAGVEQRVDALALSSLVTPIGGLATYPSMVVESSRAADTLTSVAHEWVHAYLFFRPLGATYWSSQSGRAINETVADLVGRELGAMLAERAGLRVPQPATRAAPDRVFRQEMRATRLEVERLLAIGAIDEAERYMERRRLELEALGYHIRRLNQAYFAFYGSYAEGAAGDNRIGTLVRELRQASPSLAAFLASAASVQSTDDLRRLLNHD
jgi:hypothetical protein